MTRFFSPLRIRKAWADLWANEMRTLMSVLAVAIGLLGAGSVLTAYAILEREIDANFLSTTPASFELGVTNVDADLAGLLVDQPGKADVELRRVDVARIRNDDGGWESLQLRVVEDFESLKIATIKPERGVWPPPPGQIVIERSSADVDTLEATGIVQVEAGDESVELPLAGVVHDPGRAPGWQDDLNYGYITVETFADFVQSDGDMATYFDEVYVLVDGDANDQTRNAELAASSVRFLESKGYVVSKVVVPPPGEHPHNDQMAAVLFLLQAFGGLTLVLSGVLVATIISNIVNQQRRQLGAMKAIGGSAGQIAGIYLILVLFISVAALVPGIFLASSAGRGMAGFVATLLNFDIADATIPAWVYAVQVAVGIGVPIVAAAVPVWLGVRTNVRDAIDDYQVGSRSTSLSAFSRAAGRFVGLQTLLAVRNTFRQRTRLAATLTILSLAGATFTSSLNLTDSWLTTIDGGTSNHRFDIELSLTGSQPPENIQTALSGLDEITAVEAWTQAAVSEVATSSTTASDELLVANLNGVPPETTMVDYPILEGRWLKPDDTNAVVINHEIDVDEHLDIGVGDTVTLDTTSLGADETTEWEVVGVVRQIGAPRRGLQAPFHAFVNIDHLADVTGSSGTNSIRVRTADNSATGQAAAEPIINQALADADIGVAAVMSTSSRFQILRDHVVVIVGFLYLMTGLTIGVGALALASLSSINVSERRREIGIMRAVGATGYTIQRLVLAEALTVGAVSWVLSMLIAQPLSVLLGNTAGQLFIRSDLENVFSWRGGLIWLAAVLVISLVAAYYPARKASQLPVSTVLAYE